MNLEAQREAFSRFFSHLLKEQNIPFQLTVKPGYHNFTLEKTVYILDMLTLPYRKPEVNGIHFCLDEFVFHNTALQSRVLALLKQNKTVFARNCAVKRIDKHAAEAFFSRYHLAGYRKAKFKYGLFYKSNLVAAATFAQGRNLAVGEEKIRSYECIGFCQTSGITVTGGLSKLITHFVREKKADHLSTYIDAGWSKGEAFKRIGFKRTQQLPPLPFTVNWETGERSYPTRTARNRHIDLKEYGYHNSGYLKFEHFYKANP